MCIRDRLRTGDLLVRADDVELTSLEDLFGLLASVPDGTTVELGVVRGTDELTVAATFPGTAAVDDGDDDDA